MSATLPTNFNPNHTPTAAEMAQVLNAITRITNITVGTFLTTAGLAASGSTSYVDVTGTSINWTKNGDSSSSDVLAIIMASCFVSVASTQPFFGLAIGATDYDVVAMTVNPINTHTMIGGVRAITGVAAGVYTPKVRFKRGSGTGTTSIDTGDSVTVLVAEL